MRAFLTTLLICLLITPAFANQNNDIMKGCVEISANYSDAAKCYFEWRNKKNEEELAELRDFLNHNPRYRFPGQSLNRCFGKPREMPFESAYIKADKNGFEAGITYKDNLPAGCYENAPWDNRETK